MSVIRRQLFRIPTRSEAEMMRRYGSTEVTGVRQMLLARERKAHEKRTRAKAEVWSGPTMPKLGRMK